MSALDVSHFWRIALLGNKDSGLVVFMQHQFNRAAKEGKPSGYNEYPWWALTLTLVVCSTMPTGKCLAA